MDAPDDMTISKRQLTQTLCHLSRLNATLGTPRYPSASIINKERLVFNVKGNGYRVIIAVKFEFHCLVQDYELKVQDGSKRVASKR